MNVRNVHSRELPVPLEQVSALVDGLGAAGDRLWPSDRWPATPLVLDGPLAVGTPSHQGLLRSTRVVQAVDEYEPGRRLVFRFAPGLGLVGTHRLEAQALDAERTLLTHTLECRVEPKMIAVYPLLIRLHDALVEDLLDRAELATTGTLADPARWPASVRIANAIEVRVARRRGLLPRVARAPVGRTAEICAVGVPVVLTAIAALHAAWALGWHWPGGSERELAEHVLSSAERARLGGGLPPAPATWAVALALTSAAAVVRAVAAGTPSRALRGAAWGVAAVFLARGLVFLPSDMAGGLEDTYQRLDLTVYSPLCLALAGATATVARSPRPSRSARRPGCPTPSTSRRSS